MPVSNERLPQPPVATRRTAPRCSTCSRRFLCMPTDLSARELAQVDDIVGATRAIRRGGRLFSANDRFENVYKVRTGSLKAVLMHREGVEQITSFFVAGETVGLDGLSVDRHACDAIALEDSSVCVIPFAALEKICLGIRAMQRYLHRAMSGEIVRESALVMMLGTMSAEQRVAAFLLNLSDRVGGRGYPREELELRMTREEIGSYLGLKLETVSRMLSKFTRDGLIQARAKRVRIVDREGLSKI